MSNTVTIGDAAIHLPEIVDRVYTFGEQFSLTRAGTVVAEVLPPSQGPFLLTDLAELMKKNTRLEVEDAIAFERELQIACQQSSDSGVHPLSDT